MSENIESNTRERQTLWLVLWLNAGLAGILLVAGSIGDSSALLANGLDNLSDAAVYALSLIALSHGIKWKTRAARASGIMLLLFALGMLFDVGRRYFYGSEPVGATMMAMAALAAVINYICLRRLQGVRDPDVNVRAATTFSLNDFISNGGILVAGALVLLLGANWPDLVVGLATALIATKGGIEILRDAAKEASAGS